MPMFKTDVAKKRLQLKKIELLAAYSANIWLTKKHQVGNIWSRVWPKAIFNNFSNLSTVAYKGVAYKRKSCSFLKNQYFSVKFEQEVYFNIINRFKWKGFENLKKFSIFSNFPIFLKKWQFGKFLNKIPDQDEQFWFYVI